VLPGHQLTGPSEEEEENIAAIFMHIFLYMVMENGQWVKQVKE
jgi:hypothetical protein